MEIKRNKSTKVIVVAIAILLCLALAVGITGAFYQAQRRATGTVKMDKGIVIDYTGFGKEADGIWVRENETTFRLFADTDVQPGEKISPVDAGIKANASSVDFYARVKLSYEFYNGETKLETLPSSFKASDLITTSATFFGSDWVKSNDGYHYYATGTTLNKFVSGGEYIDLFDTNAQFIIEGADFTGSYPDGEGGGFVIDETTSINKIVVYLTLETLQGDANPTDEGWKITEEQDRMELTSTDYIIETTTDEETSEEITIYTPNDDYVLANPEYAFKFTIDDTAKTATITGPVGAPTSLTIPSKILLDGQNYDVIAIGPVAFMECASLQQIKLPTSLKSIEFGAFAMCTNLCSINIPNGVNEIGPSAFVQSGIISINVPSSVENIGIAAFSDCAELTSATIGSTIPASCFGNCTNLETVNLSEGLEFIGSYAFSGCEKLKNLNLPESLTTLDANALSGCSLLSVVIPDNVTNFGDSMFMNCVNLQSVVIGDGITSLGNSTFDGCTNLQSIEIGNEITEIPESYFSGYAKLNSVKLGNNITTIGNNAFSGCSELTSITIPDSIEKIGNVECAFDELLNVFEGCNNLQPSIVEDGIAYLGNETNKYVMLWKINDRTKTNYTIQNGCKIIYTLAFSSIREEDLLTNVTSINLPNSIKRIGIYAFYRCSALQTINFSSNSNLSEIDYGAFILCTSLASITLPDSLITINECAFYGSGLSFINIPKNVTSIKFDAFAGCGNLETMEVSAENTKFHSNNNCIIETLSKTLVAGCKNSVIPTDGSVTNIGEAAFVECTGLTTIVIPNSVTNINKQAFAGCTNLGTTIGEGWIKVEDSSAVDAGTLLRDITYAIRRNA